MTALMSTSLAVTSPRDSACVCASTGAAAACRPLRRKSTVPLRSPSAVCSGQRRQRADVGQPEVDRAERQEILVEHQVAGDPVFAERQRQVLDLAPAVRGRQHRLAGELLAADGAARATRRRPGCRCRPCPSPRACSPAISRPAAVMPVARHRHRDIGRRQRALGRQREIDRAPGLLRQHARCRSSLPLIGVDLLVGRAARRRSTLERARDSENGSAETWPSVSRMKLAVESSTCSAERRAHRRRQRADATSALMSSLIAPSAERYRRRRTRRPARRCCSEPSVDGQRVGRQRAGRSRR